MDPGKNLWVGIGTSGMDVTATPVTSNSILLKFEEKLVRTNTDTTKSNYMPRASKIGDVFEFQVDRNEGTLRVFLNMEDLGIAERSDWIKTTEFYPIFHIDAASVTFI